jgi:hypothetical protein
LRERARVLKRSEENHSGNRNSRRDKEDARAILKTMAERKWFEEPSPLPFNSETNFARDEFKPKSERSWKNEASRVKPATTPTST